MGGKTQDSQRTHTSHSFLSDAIYASPLCNPSTSIILVLLIVLRGERAEQTAADLHLNKRQQAAETILGQLQKSNVDKSKRNQRQPVPIRAIQSVNDEHELLSVLEGVEDWSMYQAGTLQFLM